MSGLLTTHVLDTMHGSPAAGLRIQLWRLIPPGPHSLPDHGEGEIPGGLDDFVEDAQRELRVLLKVTCTNDQGRTEEPLLQDEDLLSGRYELIFAVGDYFAVRQVMLPEPAFLDLVPVRFGIADPSAHYHVPLLVSPWAYSTYRGS